MAYSFGKRCWLGTKFIFSGLDGAVRRYPKAALLVVALSAWVIVEYSTEAPVRHVAATPVVAERQPLAVVRNSPWDGSVAQIERYLKNNLRDPDSFEAISWGEVVNDGERFSAWCKYRAKNGFGGYSVEHQVFVMDQAGVVIAVLPVAGQ